MRILCTPNKCRPMHWCSELYIARSIYLWSVTKYVSAMLGFCGLHALVIHAPSPLQNCCGGSNSKPALAWYIPGPIAGRKAFPPAIGPGTRLLKPIVRDDDPY